MKNITDSQSSGLKEEKRVCELLGGGGKREKGESVGLITAF